MRLFSRPGSRLSAAALAAALLLAAGCTPDPEERAPQCPTAMLRPDAASFTRYDGRGTDLANLVLSGRLVDIQGACKGLLGHKALTAHANAIMELTRGPAATGRDVDVPYIVAVTKDGRPVDRREKQQHVTFPPNVDTVQATTDDVNFAFPTTRGLGGEKYAIYFLFALSPEELAANRRALHQQ
jgi:hypothetical protein